MSCYFRQLDDLFEEAGIEVNKKNREVVDELIHHIVDMPYKDCPKTWQKVKEWLADNKLRDEMVIKLRESKL